jgi:hypothetical protein
VPIAIPDAGVAAVINSVADELSPEILQAGRGDHPASMLGGIMDRGTVVRAALKAGVLGVFIGMIPFLGIVLTGALAVYFYRRENGLVLPAALGSRVGAAAGVVAFAINSLLIAIRIFVFHAQQEYIDAILKFSQAFGANVADADVQTGVRDLFTPSGLAITFVFGMVFTLVLASAGGAAASWFLRPRDPRA